MVLEVVGGDGTSSMRSNNQSSSSGSGGGGDGVSEFSSVCSEQFQNSTYDGFASHEDEISLAANMRLKQTSIDSDEKAQMLNKLLSLPALGLSLKSLPPFLDFPEVAPRKRKTTDSTETAPRKRKTKRKEVSVQSMSEKEKLKASNFCASLLRIGSWQRVTQHEGDLVAKCYYAKRKLVWEILDNGLKSKIEVQWSDIVAIRAVIEENKPGILEIELGQPPTFHRESNPQPRKHTMWNAASDFTNGQALIHRRHYIQFPPGLLDKHYEKLLQCESRLFELSKRPFPSLRSPYFQSHNGATDISFDFSSRGTEIPFNLPIHFQTHLDHNQQFQAYEQTKPSLSINHSTSPISVMDLSSPLDEVIGSQGVENPCVPSWNPQLMAHLLARHPVPGTLSVGAAGTQVNPAISCQNWNGPITYTQEYQTLYDIEKHLLSTLNIEPHANRLGSSFGFPQNVNSAATTGTRQTGYGQQMTANGNFVAGAIADTGQSLPQNWVMAPPPQSWVQPQLPPRNSGMHPGDDSSRYPPFTPNPTMGDFATFNNRPWR